MEKQDKINLLLVEDNRDDVEIITHEIKKAGFDAEVFWTDQWDKVEKQIKKEAPDILITDYRLENFTGDDVLSLVKKYKPEIPVIVVSAALPDDVALKVIQRGALDYISKNQLSKLGFAIYRALENIKYRKQINTLLKESIEIRKNQEILINQLPGAVISLMCDEILTMTYCSPQWKELTGYDPSQFLFNYSYSLIDIITEEDREFVKKRILQEKQAGKNIELRMRILDAHQKQRWLQMYGTYTLTEERQFRMDAFLQDITISIEQQNELHEKIVLLENLIKTPTEFAIFILKKSGPGWFDYYPQLYSPSLQNILDLNEEEIKDFSRWLAGIDKEEQERLMEKYVKPVNRGHFSHVFSYTTPSGKKRYISVQATALLDAENNPSNIYGIIKDVTQEYESSVQIKKNISLLRRMYHSAPMGFTFISLDGLIQDINNAKCSMLGYTKEELLNTSVFDLFSPGQNIPLQELEEKARQGKTITLHFIKLKKKNGNDLIVDLYLSPILDKDGNLTGTLSVSVDQTEKYREYLARDILAKVGESAVKSENLREFLEDIRKFISTALDTRNFFIAFYDEEEDTLELKISYDEKDAFEKVPAQGTLSKWVIQSGKPLLIKEKEIIQWIQEEKIKKVGTIPRCWLGVPLKDRNNKAYGILTLQSYSDEEKYTENDLMFLELLSSQISLFIENNIQKEQLKKREKELTEAQKKAEESDKLKSAFLANISHEVRTPMNAIIGFAQLIQDEATESETIQEFTRYIIRNSRILLNHIEDIIDISRIESGEFEISLAPVRLESIIHSLVSKFKDELAESGKDIVLKTRMDNPGLIFQTDEARLKQMLSCLIDNAIKFTQDGYVELSAEEIKKYNKRALRLCVKDTGIGIPPDKQQIIFERFVQAEDSHTRQFGGLGLGLSIVKKLADMLNAEIQLNSELHQGTEVIIDIPLVEVEEETKTVAEVQHASEVSEKKILIVEDIYSNYLYLYKVLKSNGYNTLWAMTGEEALKLARENEDINLVLLDINLPDKTGYEVLNELKTLNKNIPVIAQTAYAHTEDRVKVFEAGFDDYLAKPIKKDLLLKKLNQHLKPQLSNNQN